MEPEKKADDVKVFEGLEEVSDAGSDSGDSDIANAQSSEKPKITEEEAKLLLQETKMTMNKSGKSKNSLAAVIVAAVLLVGAGVAAIALLGKTKDDMGVNGGATGESAVVEKPDSVNQGGSAASSQESDALREISIYDPKVAMSYDRYSAYYCGDLTSSMSIYSDDTMQSGQIAPIVYAQMAIDAMGIERAKCKMEPTSDNLKERYTKFPEGHSMWYDGLYQDLYNFGCFSGSDITNAISYVFGLNIPAADVLVDTKDNRNWWAYSDKYDEFFFNVTGVGCSGPPPVRQKFKAEEKGDELYVYEALVSLDDNLELLLANADKEEMQRKYGYWDHIYDNLYSWLDSRPEYMRDYPDYFLQYKWTFRKGDNGYYMFAGIEKIK